MELHGENVLLRIFINVFQKWHHQPVYEAIVGQARKKHLAGATVLEGQEGFGQKGVILAKNPWALSSDREVIVEIVDSETKIETFLQEIEPMLKDAIVTLERAAVLSYRHGDKKVQP